MLCKPPFMDTTLDFQLTGTGRCANAAQSMGCMRFAPLAEHIRNLPYGRVPGDSHGLTVVREGRGTCSSKHQFLAALAHECGRADIVLTVGLYRMSARTNPAIGPILMAAGFDDILEAHCYLTYQRQRYDFTGLPAGAVSPFDVLIDERGTTPENLAAMKVPYHREALIRWARAHGVDAGWAWAVREQCIEALARPRPTPASTVP